MPFCGTAVIEALLGTEPAKRVVDPYLAEVQQWGYQDMQLHQKLIVDRARVLHGFMSKEEYISAQFQAIVVDTFLNLPGADPKALREKLATVTENN